jgi:SNF2 family DNA or RNA helicase
MQIIHVAIEKGKAFIWSEKKFYSLPVNTTPRKRISTQPKVHPFCGTPEDLAQAFPHLSISKDTCIKSLVWLPSTEEFPSPSNPVLGEIPLKFSHVEVAPWAIWAYELPVGNLLEWMTSLDKKEILSPGIFLGKEFSFFVQLGFFVLSLVLRQRYLPSIREMEDSFSQAFHKPIFSGVDNERLIALEKAMPDVCRAFTTLIKQQICPEVAPKKILRDFITETLNAFVRSTGKDLNKEIQSSVIHDIWAGKLVSSNPNLKTSDNGIHEFIKTVEEWQRPILNTLSSPFKLCLRLEEPESTDPITSKNSLAKAASPWRVSYFLQPYDDPSLLVTTQQVWNPKGIKRKLLERPDFNARQFILTSLVMATGLCPHIESSLNDPIPTGFNLDSNQAFLFLQEESSHLEDAGFGIICPKWWKKKLALTAKPFIKSSFQAKKKQSLWDSLNTDWKIYIGELGLSEKELYELSLLKEPMIKMRGEWVLLSKNDIDKALTFLKNKPLSPKNALDILKMAAGISAEQYGVKIEKLEATGWVAEFLDAIKDNQPMKLLEPPNEFQGKLRPYQLRGYSWMSFLQNWKLGACLADDMGLGKTPQTLAMLMRSWKESEEPSLLICPTSLTGNWSRESAKFVPDLPIHVHHGIRRQKGEGFRSLIKKSALIITSYATLLRDAKLFNEIKWKGIILDEAQNIKNAETKQTKVIQDLKSEYRLALTGTPVENNVGDLWSIMNFLNPGYLGSKESFKMTFFKPIQLEKDIKATESLKQLTKPLILRRLKTDKSIISDLPEKIEMKVYCSLTQEQISLYESVVDEANRLLEVAVGIARKGIILSTLSKLKQICNHPTNFLSDASNLDNRSGKLLRLLEILKEIQASGERCLLFTQYTEMGTLLKTYLEEYLGKEVLFLHGGTTKKRRDEMVQQFQSNGNSSDIFILSLKAGGVGLNLTQACHVFHFDRWWNPAIENQATDRAFRIGQTKNVHVHKFICTGTIEERIDEMIESKKEVASNVIGTGEGWLTEFSTESLKELWKLQKSAII